MAASSSIFLVSLAISCILFSKSISSNCAFKVLSITASLPDSIPCEVCSLADFLRTSSNLISASTAVAVVGSAALAASRLLILVSISSCFSFN